MEAERRDLVYFDATCPLVTKVHKSAARYSVAERMVILIGHAGHPEVVGTLGQLPSGRIALVESIEDVMALDFPADQPLAYITQTTLSVDDTATIVAALKQRFPEILGMAERDICYATTNRQNAVKTIAPDCDGLIVIGASNSSNSRRLVEVAQANGCSDALLLSDAGELDPRLAAGQGSGRDNSRRLGPGRPGQAADRSLRRKPGADGGGSRDHTGRRPVQTAARA